MAQKTPVSLMNELAKANKLNPEYKVTEESGPAHKRTFTVQLTLGDVGTWEGKATSIRAAKHAAANLGLDKCGLCMPEVGKPRVQQVHVTPTVELNVLAMKLGKLTKYEELAPKMAYQHPVNMGYQAFQMQHQLPGYHHGGPPRPRSPYGLLHPYSGQDNHYRSYIHNDYHPRSAPPRIPRIACVKLIMGDQEFYGEGRDKQAARKNAASKAVRVIREELAAAGEQGELIKPADVEAVVQNGNESIVSQPESSPKSTTPELKSEISQLYEIASKRKLLVGFEDVSSSGPPHMKRFVVSATVGEFVTQGEGCKKKNAKQEAARKMLQELKKLPELPAQDENLKKVGRFVRRGPRIANDKKTKGDIDPTLNPVSILGQLFQRRGEEPPMYQLLHEGANAQEREFTIQVIVGPHSATGAGPNKKEAKKRAAEAMLKLIGFRSAEVQPASAQGDKGVKIEKTESEPKGPFNDPSSGSQPATILRRQLKPGLLPMVPELAKHTRPDMMTSVVAPIAQVKEVPQEPVVQGGLNRAPGAPVVKAAAPILTAVQKLFHLAELEGLRVQFTDYPKEREYLTLVTVSCIPPITCYGSGVTVESAREEAASNALKPLLQLGLDRSTTCTLKSFEDNQGGLLPQPTNNVTSSDNGRENQVKKE